MTKIAYILLAHKNTGLIEAQVKALTSAGDCVAIHFDKNGNDADYAALTTTFLRDPNVVFVPRVRCGWGEWSLVKASLEGLQMAETAFPTATHFFLISGDCAPIKSSAYIHAQLADSSKDYIEHNDYFSSGWIKTGLKEDRLHYRHFFNERSQKRLFYWSYEFQKLTDLKRAVPDELEMRIGSQWWCLRRSSVEKLLTFVEERPDVVRFFKTVWIPDECFFQTIILNAVARKELVNAPPTFLMFSDYGKPVTFHIDHMDFLKRQDRFFARKITDHVPKFREELNALYMSDDMPLETEGTGTKVYSFLTQKGRVGKRFGQRFWEVGRSIGTNRTLLIVVSAKRDFTERLLRAVRASADIPAFGYVFNDEHVDLPDLGGIEKELQKRTMHRRAFMKVLFDVTEQDTTLICMDPSTRDIFNDLGNDDCATKVLFVEGAMEDHHLREYAHRRGLLSQTDSQEQDEILEALRKELSDELAAFQRGHKSDANVEGFTVRPSDAMTKNAAPLADFLGISPHKARTILRLAKQ